MSKEKKVIVSEDSSLSEKEKKSLTSGGMITIESKEQLMEMSRKANERFDGFKEDAQQISQEQAAFVRELRVDKDYSWRMVSAECYHNPLFKGWGNKGDWYPDSNQIMGMALCEKASEFFGENYMKKPWN